MALVVLSYPKFNSTDFEWIQKHRKKYDVLYYNIIDPHFALVFPTSSLSEKQFISEISNISQNERPIKFVIRSAVINKDSFIDTYHEFLLPDEGHSSIIKLHDKLYSKKLFPDLRLDIDFIPHIGIGNSKDPLKCKSNVDHINKSNIEIHGIIDSLDIAVFENNGIETLCVIELDDKSKINK